MAAAEQYQRPFGFLNAALYRLAGTRAIHDAPRITGTSPSRYRGVACDLALCGVLSYLPFDVES